MYLSKNLKYLRLKNHLSQNEIAEMLGYKSFTTIQKWESGDSEPTVKVVRKLADYYKVNINDLISKDLEQNSIPSNDYEISRVPILGAVPCGIPLNAIQEIVGWEEVPASENRDGKLFGIRASGDSMSPKIEDGDVLIFRQQPDAETGDIVIAMVNHDDATCKRLKKTKDGISLIPLNLTYEPYFFTWKEVEELPVSIIGKIVEIRRRL